MYLIIYDLNKIWYLRNNPTLIISKVPELRPVGWGIKRRRKNAWIRGVLHAGELSFYRILHCMCSICCAAKTHSQMCTEQKTMLFVVNLRPTDVIVDCLVPRTQCPRNVRAISSLGDWRPDKSYTRSCSDRRDLKMRRTSCEQLCSRVPVENLS